MSGELDFIDWITRQARPDSAFVQRGIGDDLAILNWPPGDLLLVGVDQVLDRVHFDLRTHSPADIGAKAMNRNLSDCAAMACLPAAALACVALPRQGGQRLSRELYAGLRSAADAFNCPIVGGDTGSWDGPLSLSVTIFGRSDGIRPVERRGARPGDGLFVTGPLGGSILGRHLRFTPRVALARQIAATLPIHAMIDLSDGLSRDVAHICRQSGVGAVIEASLVPIHADARVDRHDGRSPLEHALHDGEDYELLFAAPCAVVEGVTRIGRIVDGATIMLESQSGPTPLRPLGWEHAL